jgi:3,4-dihydroxy 2-butanone 4-phosphate synthase/GTP cyclohydrolase II
MARRPELERFAEEHGLLMVTIADLIRYRRQTERLVDRLADAVIPTDWGDFTCIAYRSEIDSETHLALVKGEPAGQEAVLVRVHSECVTGDVFGSRRCDCGSQLHEAIRMISAAGVGVIVYLRGHEGRGIGIASKLDAYRLQDRGYDTVDANTQLGLPIDSREYGIGAQILVDLGVSKMRLMTNNPSKRGGLEGYGLEIIERLPIISVPTAENVRYLRTKRERMGHLLGAMESDPVTAVEGTWAMPAEGQLFEGHLEAPSYPDVT